jgi:XTP/dITP diphosphohydrolase
VPPRLVLATLNPGKARELAELLAGVPYELVPLSAVAGAALPEESEDTYEGNALLKARAACRLTGARALADDSGLEVDALGGAPGVQTARYGGAGLTDADRYRRLLDSLAGVPTPRRTARFRCVIAIVDPGGGEALVEGRVEGLIAEAPRGGHGFGYDPVFLYPPLGKTFGELTADEKAPLSHRGRAVAAARKALMSG